MGSTNGEFSRKMADGCLPKKKRNRPEIIKMFHAHAAQHEILNPHEYKNIKKFSFFSGSNKPKMLFFLYVKMPTIVCILIFMSRKKFSCSAELSMKICL